MQKMKVGCRNRFFAIKMIDLKKFFIMKFFKNYL